MNVVDPQTQNRLGAFSCGSYVNRESRRLWPIGVRSGV
jgi:hypothetical protein